jgi:hypothetical protein
VQVEDQRSKRGGAEATRRRLDEERPSSGLSRRHRKTLFDIYNYLHQWVQLNARYNLL